MAIVKIDPAELGVELKPAIINKTPAQTGQRVYAIGNPGTGTKVKLTKTVTSGLLSGVDREIEDVSYLQISAPINPGNSGGPLCDKAGKVIGVVTLKLTDVENVGFALPITQLQLAEFKPLRERATSPEKADKLLESSNRMIADINRLRARGLGKSAEAEFLRMLAIKIMHEALLLDSTNGTVYSAIAELLDEFDDHDQARAYFLAGLEASPWGRDPRIYRAFGMHMLRQKKPDEALAIWGEGIAKHPHLASQIWEDLATVYRDRNDWLQAARCATAVSVLKNPSSHFHITNAIGGQAVAKTEGEERAQLLAEVSQMGDELLRRTLRRNAYLEQQRTVLTSPFADFLAKQNWRLEPEATTKAQPQKMGGYELRLTDLLDVANPGFGGKWTKEKGTLTSPAAGFTRIDATLDHPPGEYDLLVEVERLQGKDELALGLVRHGEPAMIAFDFGGTKTGVAGVKSPTFNSPVLPQNQLVSLVIQVRQSGLKIRVNEQPLLAIEQTDKFPTVPSRWRGQSPAQWFLASSDSSFAIHGWWLVKALPKSDPPIAVTSADTPVKPITPIDTPITTIRPSPTPAPAAPVAGVTPGALGLHEIAQLPDTRWGMKCLAISPDGKFVAGGKPDNAVWIFDIAKNAKVSDSGRLDDLGGISVVAFTPEGDKLLAGGWKGKVQIWNVRDGALVVDRDYVGHGKELLCMEISADGKYVLSGAREERLRCWELATSKEHYAWDGFKSGPKAVHFTKADEALATDGESLVKINLQDGKAEKLPFKLASYVAQSAAFSPNGEELAVTDGQRVRRWKVADGQELPPLETTEMIWTVRYSPDGKRMYTGGRAVFHVWERESGKPLDYVGVGKHSYIQTLAVSRDGKRIAVIPNSAGQTLQVFETKPQ